MYLLLPKHLSLKDMHRNESSIQDGKLNILNLVLTFPLLFVVMSLFDSYIFVAYDLVKLLIYSLILFTVLATILLIFTKEYKTKKSALFIIIFVCLLLSPAVVHKIDLAYDFTAPQKIDCEIIDMPTWTDNNNNITYYLTFSYNHKNVKAEVSKDAYEKYQIGDKVAVIKIHGGLGIEKLILRE